MAKSTLLISVARPEDGQAWVQLSRQAGSTLPPDLLTEEVKRFNAPPPDVDESRFIVWADGEAISRASLNQLENVIELRDFNIAGGHIAEYGSTILQHFVDLARARGTLLTIDSYPPAYSGVFLACGFTQNTRTRMTKSLLSYTPRPVALPGGVTLRRPILDDETAVAEMAYNNYIGTPDEEMVSGSRSQSTAIIHAMFHNDYNLLNPIGSYLAADSSGMLIGSVLHGDASHSPHDPQAWIMDISIAPQWRGKGLGKALMNSTINAAALQGYQRIGLMVTISNKAAHSLYSSLSFEAYGDIMYEAYLKLK